MINLRRCIDYIQGLLKIRTKSGDVIPFILNPAQMRLYDKIREQSDAGKPIRIIILKARQLGFSTFTAANYFWRAATSEGVEALEVAHREDSTAKIFGMSRLFLDMLPAQVRPMVSASNAQEIKFENPSRDPSEKADNHGLRSRIRCVTAGGKGIGRSETLTCVHASEYAYWPGDKSATLLGILQAVPNMPGTSVIIESTANGFDDFKKMWDAAVNGENDFVPVFFAWWENPEYRMPYSGEIWDSDEQTIKELYKLDDEQLAWRRWCIRNNCNGDINQFRQEYPASPDDAFISSGRPVFDNNIVSARRTRVSEPMARGEFTYSIKDNKITDIKFVPRDGGIVAIYEYPKQYYPYVLGGDTAGETGNVRSDWFVGQMIDNTNGKQVAMLRHKSDEGQYAAQMYCYGMYYNTALIGIETNYSTYPVKKLMEWGYPNLYVREQEDTFTGNIRKSYGFDTNLVTRPVIIAALVEIVRDSIELINDYTTLGEMITFAYTEAGRPEALPGEHDDTVMALAITHRIRPQQRYTPALPEPAKVQWTADMRYDYDHATSAEREEMIKLWGYPK